MMKVNPVFWLASLLVIVIAFVKIVFQLHFWILPLVFFIAGLAAALWNHKHALYLFVFLFPFINAGPGLFNSEYPFNYMAVSLFLLSGIVAAAVIRKIENKQEVENTGEYLDRDFIPYYLFLLILLLSTLFVFFRWSNITLSSVNAAGADTPVSPPAPPINFESGAKWNEQRISFASIFPVVSLFLYFISPYIFFYIKKLKPEERKIFVWLSYGFFVSVGFAVIQEISGRSLISDRLGKDFKQFYGGFSDFNAFGVFSGIMLLWATYEIRKKNILGYITFAAALAGGILSGSRTVYFFILAGILNLVFNFNRVKTVQERKKQPKIVITLLILAVLLVVVFAGGTLKERLSEGFSGEESLVKKLDAVTNGRVWMTLFTLETIKDHFIPGVGTGNFIFYLAYKNYLPFQLHGEKFVYDLPLNHYLLVFAENGLLGFLFFTSFLVFLFRRTDKKLLLGTILFSLLLNNFFWFPEVFLLFWILAALNHVDKSEKEKKEILSSKHKKIGLVFFLLLFTAFNIVSFNALHPVNWSKETRIRYDYGFWYPEKDKEGNEYRWTKARAGIYLAPDKNGQSPEIKLVCGAPLSHLKEKKQTVEIYWRGKLYRAVTFTENKAFSFKIESQPPGEGFLEINVLPAFNLKNMGLSPESRDLGIQFSVEDQIP